MTNKICNIGLKLKDMKTWWEAMTCLWFLNLRMRMMFVWVEKCKSPPSFCFCFVLFLFFACRIIFEGVNLLAKNKAALFCFLHRVPQTLALTPLRIRGLLRRQQMSGSWRTYMRKWSGIWPYHHAFINAFRNQEGRVEGRWRRGDLLLVGLIKSSW